MDNTILECFQKLWLRVMPKHYQQVKHYIRHLLFLSTPSQPIEMLATVGFSIKIMQNGNLNGGTFHIKMNSESNVWIPIDSPFTWNYFPNECYKLWIMGDGIYGDEPITSLVCAIENVDLTKQLTCTLLEKIIDNQKDEKIKIISLQTSIDNLTIAINNIKVLCNDNDCCSCRD